MVDDWSYAFSAKVLAETGHVTYNGWAAMPLTWILYLGALAIRVFGFSFAAVRSSMLLVSVLTILLMYRLLRRSGLSGRYCVIGTMAMALSPPFFSNMPLFMSDIPGFLALLLCYFCVLRALETNGAQRATFWLASACLVNTAVGSCRQIALLGVLVLVPCAWFHLRRCVRHRLLAPVWLGSVAGAVALVTWFDRQTYSIHEPLLPKAISFHTLLLVPRVMLGMVFFLLPLAAFLVDSLRWRNRVVQVSLGVFGLAMLPASWLMLRARSGAYLMPYLLDTLTTGGFHDVDRLAGLHVAELGRVWQVGLTCLSWFLTVGIILYAAAPRFRMQKTQSVGSERNHAVLSRVFLPFTVAFFALYATRRYAFDRYLLPLMFLAVWAVLLLLQRQRGRGTVPRAVAASMLLLGAFDVAALHDVFARYRARLAAIQEIEHQGVPRERISGGFEFDAWTELEQTGYVRWPGALLRSGKRQPAVGPGPECRGWFLAYTPHVRAEYTVARSLTECTEAAGLVQVPYTAWLSMEQRSIVPGKLLPAAH